ncbi:alpha-1,4-glucan:alpha-1,4-glucan 6-glycosyltransferase [Salinimicrobium catena]|uniref:1,4-alpha-glucan branching enzyme GlgB n=2 Tax=Salinimicrobium catena TaxID=390640 RepID=A0A1H5M161_9FLAO|nr:alpha-1,4-glucan:alpha-1,4-glucan 6-glycosyltransferase [Salinimicrobium catena]SEE83043.1 alpha-1,4-glucan:alpha-1,4-glucan 6-glycosyltransferase [Salinimicrobium catena]
MAKKKENTTDKDKKTTAKKASPKPERSGQVKGPIDVGDRKKTEDTAKVKKPAKDAGPSAEDVPKKKSTAKETASLPKPKKSLPKKTSKSGTTAKAKTSGKKTAGTADKKTKISKKPAKFHEPLTDEELPDVAAPASKQTSTPDEEKKRTRKTAKTKEAIKASEDPTRRKKATKKAPEPEDKEAPRKMSRHKADPAISAEEKMKQPNTSPSEDLKHTTESLAKELAEKLSPDEKTRSDIEKMARELIPDADDVKGAAEKLTAALASTPEKARELMKKIIPDEEDLSEMAEKARTVAKKATPTKKEKQESSKDKPVEATLITDYDVHLFKEGKHYHLYKKFGSHLMEYMGTQGVYFAVWAPNAEKIAVMGDFNNWSKDAHMMKARWDHSGIWEVFIPEAKKGSLYKYFIRSNNGYEAEKGDPFAFSWETPPNTASMVWDLENTWKDKSWMEARSKKEEPAPYSVYEIHMGSWKRVPEDGFRSLSYRELAEDLPGYLKEMGFTHVEFMPVMEHPFFGSWGYQITGYFAPSSRYGTPQDFMYLIDSLHQAGIGVILDWVPSHFPSDLHGLHYFDGTYLYEHADPKKGFHPDWQSYIFNYGRNEVRAFLISNALFWLDMFHADGLRVDAVASMLYLDYSRNEGEWEPNEFGGRENLEAISFLKEFNEAVYKEFPDAITIAEESTAWPMVSKPTYIGGLGFGQKWMMGWMHDTLEYFSKDPVYRRHHQNTITFSSNYAFSENFMLPLSHDEVVYGKGSILNKMPGDTWNRFANLRTLYAYMFAHPGTKLLFMGAEFGQPSEWNHDGSLEWHLTNEDLHHKVQETLKELNNIYRSEPALYEKAFSSEGFEWVDINDEENSIISFLRKGKDPKDNVMVVCNFTPVPRENYRLGVAEAGNWREIFNSDDERFGGSNVKNQEVIEAQSLPAHRKEYSLALTIPPMAVIYLKRD